MSEREDLTQRDEIIGDLDGDLEDIAGIFKLVEEAMKQQNLQSNTATGLRSTSRNLAFETAVDPNEAKSGVLDEVRALQPNHENRLEAIERAEKQRRRELENRKGGDFQREVEHFVGEGKLRKTGGAEEVERQRMVREEKARRDNYEWMEKRRAEMERRRVEEEMGLQPQQEEVGAVDRMVVGDAGVLQYQDASGDEEEEGDFEIMPDGSVRTKPKYEDAANGDRGSGPPQLPEIELGDSEIQRRSSEEHAPGRDVERNPGMSTSED